ncbi:hypothetical protein ACFROC_10190, partial [Nocardia tengchongensis]|uniref:hypothetical protein n=1 Tax=Nocardia tengchongensis TaxID=2055889 RepID=UPI0036BE503A
VTTAAALTGERRRGSAGRGFPVWNRLLGRRMSGGSAGAALRVPGAFPGGRHPIALRRNPIARRRHPIPGRPLSRVRVPGRRHLRIRQGLTGFIASDHLGWFYPRPVVVNGPAEVPRPIGCGLARR